MTEPPSSSNPNLDDMFQDPQKSFSADVDCFSNILRSFSEGKVSNASLPSTALPQMGSSNLAPRRRLAARDVAPRTALQRSRLIPLASPLAVSKSVNDSKDVKVSVQRLTLLGQKTKARYVLGPVHGPSSWIGYELWAGRIQQRPSFIIQQLRDHASSSSDCSSGSKQTFSSDVLAQLHILSEERLALFQILPVVEYAVTESSAAEDAHLQHSQLTKSSPRYIVLPHYQSTLKGIWEKRAQHVYTTTWEVFVMKKLIQLLTALRFLHAHQFLHGCVDLHHIQTDENGNTCALVPSDITRQQPLPGPSFPTINLTPAFDAVRPPLHAPEVQGHMTAYPQHALDIWQLGMTTIDLLSTKPNLSADVYRALMFKSNADGLQALLEELDPNLTRYPKWALIVDLLSAMLRWNPQARENAFDLLSHQFFHDYLLLNHELFHLVHAPLILKLQVDQREKIFLFRQRAATISSVRNKRDSTAQELAMRISKILAATALPAFPQKVQPGKLWSLILQYSHGTLSEFIMSNPQTSTASTFLKKWRSQASGLLGQSTPSPKGSIDELPIETSTSKTYATDECIWSLLAKGDFEDFKARMENEGALLSTAGESGGMVVLTPSQIPQCVDFITQCIHEHRLRVVGTGIYLLDGLEIITPVEQQEHHNTPELPLEDLRLITPANPLHTPTFVQDGDEETEANLNSPLPNSPLPASPKTERSTPPVTPEAPKIDSPKPERSTTPATSSLSPTTPPHIVINPPEATPLQPDTPPVPSPSPPPSSVQPEPAPKSESPASSPRHQPIGASTSTVIEIIEETDSDEPPAEPLPSYSPPKISFGESRSVVSDVFEEFSSSSDPESAPMIVDQTPPPVPVQVPSPVPITSQPHSPTPSQEDAPLPLPKDVPSLNLETPVISSQPIIESPKVVHEPSKVVDDAPKVVQEPTVPVLEPVKPVEAPAKSPKDPRRAAAKRRELIRSLQRSANEHEDALEELVHAFRKIQREARHRQEDQQTQSHAVQLITPAFVSIAVMKAHLEKQFSSAVYLDLLQSMSNPQLCTLVVPIIENLQQLRSAFFARTEQLTMSDALQLWHLCTIFQEFLEECIDGIPRANDIVLVDQLSRTLAAKYKISLPQVLPSQDWLSTLGDTTALLRSFFDLNPWILEICHLHDQPEATSPLDLSPYAHFLAKRSDLEGLTALWDDAKAPFPKPLQQARYAGARMAVIQLPADQLRDYAITLAQLASGHIVPLFSSDFASFVALQYHSQNLATLFSRGRILAWARLRMLLLDVAIGLSFLHSRSVAHGHLDPYHVWFDLGSIHRVALTQAPPAFSARALQKDIDAYRGLLDWIAARTEPSDEMPADLQELKASLQQDSITSMEQVVSLFRAKGFLVNRVEAENNEKDDIKEKSESLQRTLAVRSQLLVPLESELKQVTEMANKALEELRLTQNSLDSVLASPTIAASSSADDQGVSEEEMTALEAELKSLETQIRELPRLTRQAGAESREAHTARMNGLEEQLEAIQNETSALRREISTLRRG